MVVEPALKVALAMRVALTMDGLDEDVAQLAAEAAPRENPIANVPALSPTSSDVYKRRYSDSR